MRPACILVAHSVLARSSLSTPETSFSWAGAALSAPPNKDFRASRIRRFRQGGSFEAASSGDSQSSCHHFGCSGLVKCKAVIAFRLLVWSSRRTKVDFCSTSAVPGRPELYYKRTTSGAPVARRSSLTPPTKPHRYTLGKPDQRRRGPFAQQKCWP